MDNSLLRMPAVWCLLLFALVLCPPSTRGDTIVLKTGKTIEAGKTWEQAGNVQFYLNGHVINVAKNNILRIEKSPAPPPLDTTSSVMEEIKHSELEAETDSAPLSSPKPSAVNPRPRKYVATAATYRSQTFRQDPIGFRGLSWGTPLSEMKGLVKTDRAPVYGGVTEYVRSYDVPKVGNADVEKIVYGYARGGLFTITIWTSGSANFKALKEEAVQIFGPGKTVTRRREYTLWATDASNVMLVYYKSRGKGLLWMQSRNMDRQLR